MSTIKADAIEAATGTNTDLVLTGKGTGAVVLEGLSYPTADGSNGQVLVTDGAGTISFGTVAGSDQVARDMAASALAYTLAQNDATSITGSIGRFYLSDDFETDSLATKTNATYNATGDYYHNPGGLGARISGGTPTAPFGGTAANFNDNNTATELNTGTISSQFVGATVEARRLAQLDFGSDVAVSRMEVIGARVNAGSGPDFLEFYYKTDAGDWTVFGSPLTIPSSDVSATRDLGVTGRYFALVGKATTWNASFICDDFNVYDQSTPPNMTLAPTAATLATADPTDLVAYVIIYPQEAITVGTDIVMTMSIDGGTTDATGTWTKVGDIGVEELYRVEADVSAQTGSSLTYEITTANTKVIQYHDCVGIVAIY